MAANQARLITQIGFVWSLVVFLLVAHLQTTSAETKSLIPCQVQSPSYPKDTLYQESVRISLCVKGPGLEEYKQIHIIPGSTVNQVLYGYYEVVNKKVCCNNSDIWSINGIETVPGESFWVVKVNGNSQNYSSQSGLTEGDVLEVKYMSKLEYENHLSLDSWLLREK